MYSLRGGDRSLAGDGPEGLFGAATVRPTLHAPLEITKSGPRNDATNHYAHWSVTWLLLKCADFKVNYTRSL
ncbi:hypothetical protein BHM03_00021811 [Ensete ventricosum]|nr:hypothetical protein BHM03_00021811 [Ensete ventricosum]